MRLKYAMLVYPVRTPWTGTNLTESLHPKNGWELMLDGSILRICQGTKTHTVISATMLRWAEVEEEILDGIEFARNSPDPDPADILDDVYTS